MSVFDVTVKQCSLFFFFFYVRHGFNGLCWKSHWILPFLCLPFFVTVPSFCQICDYRVKMYFHSVLRICFMFIRYQLLLFFLIIIIFGGIKMTCFTCVKQVWSSWYLTCCYKHGCFFSSVKLLSILKKKNCKMCTSVKWCPALFSHCQTCSFDQYLLP